MLVVRNQNRKMVLSVFPFLPFSLSPKTYIVCHQSFPPHSTTMFVRSETYRPSRNWRIKQISKSSSQPHRRDKCYSTHLSDILVADSADLLNVGSTLRHTLERVSRELEFVLDIGRGDDLDTRLASHTAHDFLSEEVSVRRNRFCQSKFFKASYSM